MRKAFRDPKKFKFSLVIAGLQVETSPLAKVRRVAAEIDGDVPDVAGENADKFALGFTNLIMEAAEDPAGGEGLIVLDETSGQACCGKPGCVINFSEPTATITKTSGLK
jgi:hypothetical protein